MESSFAGSLLSQASLTGARQRIEHKENVGKTSSVARGVGNRVPFGLKLTQAGAGPTPP